MPRYRFDRFTLDEEAGQVFAEGKALTLQPLTYDLLHTLVQQPDRLFTRDELGALLWPDVVVLDESLTKAVSRLRKEISCSAVIRTLCLIHI